MKPKTDLERYLADQERFFQEQDLNVREMLADERERQLSEIVVNEAEAYERLVRDTTKMFIEKRHVDKRIAKELAKQFILRLLRENLEKTQQQS